MTTKNTKSTKVASQHFLSLTDIPAKDYPNLFNVAQQLKQNRWLHETALNRKNLALIFEKPSTRTRISFEVGMNQLGGNSLFLPSNAMQLSRGECLEHTALTLSSMVDAIMLRCLNHNDLIQLAENASVPVINGLSDKLHPCQLLADILTFIELRGDIAGSTICWIGNANSNMCNSYLEASYLFDFTLHIASPAELQPDANCMQKWGKNTKVFTNAEKAAKGCNAIVTDVWESMGSKLTKQQQKQLQEFQVNAQVMGQAKQDALFMHCLPMNIGQEVDKQVLDSKNSAIWNEAENRLHGQKALLLYLFGIK